MKRKDRKKKARKLSARAIKRNRKNALAQSYYGRANSISVVRSLLPNGEQRVIAELLPSTAKPNVVGVVTGTREKVEAYVDTLITISKEYKMQFKQVVAVPDLKVVRSES